MKLKWFLPLLFGLLLFPYGKSQGTVVGVSPNIIDLGQVQKNSKEIISFLILSPTNESLLVSLKAMPGSIDFFKINKNYSWAIKNFSEQNASGWVEFINNPVSLQPVKEEIKLRKGVIKGAREIRMFLNIPADAEPGYHLITITPTPIIPKPAGGRGIGVQTVATAAINVLFKIAGKAKRQGEILTIVPGNYINGFLQLKVLFKNTGTTTINAKLSSLEIFDQNNTKIASFKSAPMPVKPNEVRKFSVLLDARNLTPGNYLAKANVSYTTGYDTKTEEITITKKVETKPSIKINYLIYIFITTIILLTSIVYLRR